MKVLFVAAEVAPYAKVGGLADVAGSLPQALAALGHDVRILMPSYKMVEDSDQWSIQKVADSFEVHLNQNWSKTAYLNRTLLEGVPVYMVGTDEWFNRTTSSETIYQPGCDAYMFLAAAAMRIPEILDWRPDVVHANDWHTGFIPVLMREKMGPTWSNVASIFTIHNLAYQGDFGFDVLDKLALPHSLFNPNQLEFYGSVNFLKAGCVFADQVNTVSPTYAEEIKTSALGANLDGLMAHLAGQHRLSGILNGIDDRLFNPATDPAIAAHYDADEPGGKAVCREELLKRLHMDPIEGAMLMGSVTRLSEQKGMNLVIEALPKLLEMPCQLVVQGLGDPWLIKKFTELQIRHPQHIRFISAFDVELAQQIYAGCDAFLMPSMFEPCGLGQMIAMRYGTVPIVRETGGLADTVHEGANGFTFSDKSSEGLEACVRRAHSEFGVPESWWGIRRACLRGDYSWKQSARKYVALYERAFAQRRHTPAISA